MPSKNSSQLSVPKPKIRFIRNCAIKKITPYNKNPRINDHAVESVVSSIAQFGFLPPIITDEELNICVGNTRYKAALQLGLSSVPVETMGFPVEELDGIMAMLENTDMEFPEYDESEAQKAKMITCPNCGHEFPA